MKRQSDPDVEIGEAAVKKPLKDETTTVVVDEHSATAGVVKGDDEEDNEDGGDNDGDDDSDNDKSDDDEESESAESDTSDGDGGVRKSWRKAKPGEDDQEANIIYCVTNTAPQYGISAHISLYKTLYAALCAKHAHIAKWAMECSGCMTCDPKFKFDTMVYSGYFGDDDYISSAIGRIDLSKPTGKGSPFFQYEVRHDDD